MDSNCCWLIIVLKCLKYGSCWWEECERSWRYSCWNLLTVNGNHEYNDGIVTLHLSYSETDIFINNLILLKHLHYSLVLHCAWSWSRISLQFQLTTSSLVNRKLRVLSWGAVISLSCPSPQSVTAQWTNWEYLGGTSLVSVSTRTWLVLALMQHGFIATTVWAFLASLYWCQLHSFPLNWFHVGFLPTEI